MGDVYLGVSTGPGDFVGLLVLKVLRAGNEPENAELVKMFEAEGRIAGRLRHPNIVQTYAVGVDGEQHFIVMEYLEGQPLSRIQGRAEPTVISLETQLAVLCQILEGLEYTHAVEDFDGTPLHLVHRDVSPQNIFVTYRGEAKLLDFGIAKTLTPPRTRAGIIKGKPAYMSPEQASGGVVDHRSDLFSVGVILWEAIAGRRMHPRGSDAEIIHGVAQGSIPAIRSVVPDVPAALERVVTRALAVDRAKRYPDARSFREELLAALEGKFVPPREIGRSVESLFQADQERLRRIIREALRDAQSEDQGEDHVSEVSLSAAIDAVSSASELPASELLSPLTTNPLTTNPLTTNPLTANTETQCLETPAGVTTQPIERQPERPKAPAGVARKRVPPWALALALGGLLGSGLSMVAVFRYRAPPLTNRAFSSLPAEPAIASGAPTPAQTPSATPTTIHSPTASNSPLPASSLPAASNSPIQRLAPPLPASSSPAASNSPLQRLAPSLPASSSPASPAVTARAGDPLPKTPDANATQSNRPNGAGNNANKNGTRPPLFKVW